MRNKIRILVVDDDDALRRSIARRLVATLNAHVDEASGVSGARALLETDRYDVIVSDEEMQDGLGHDLLGTCAIVQPLCKRALMSGNDPPNDAMTWERFFAKPDALLDLVSWVQTVYTSAMLTARR